MQACHPRNTEAKYLDKPASYCRAWFKPLPNEVPGGKEKKRKEKEKKDQFIAFFHRFLVFVHTLSFSGGRPAAALAALCASFFSCSDFFTAALSDLYISSCCWFWGELFAPGPTQPEDMVDG